MDIKALGTGCANCKRTIALIDEVAKAQGVVINGKVVHADGVPARDKIEQWLAT
jgi:thiol-disulfide isomerase/thioredoxin